MRHSIRRFARLASPGCRTPTTPIARHTSQHTPRSLLARSARVRSPWSASTTCAARHRSSVRSSRCRLAARSGARAFRSILIRRTTGSYRSRGSSAARSRRRASTFSSPARQQRQHTSRSVETDPSNKRRGQGAGAAALHHRISRARRPGHRRRARRARRPLLEGACRWPALQRPVLDGNAWLYRPRRGRRVHGHLDLPVRHPQVRAGRATHPGWRDCRLHHALVVR